MIRRFVGAVAAAVGLVAGLWLMLAPFALGTQPAGLDSDWNHPAMTEFVTGAAVAFVGLIGLIAFAMAIRGEAVRRGLVGRPSAPTTDTAPQTTYDGRHAEPAVRDGEPVPYAAPAVSEDERVADLLAPLVRAFAEDMGSAEGGRPPANGGYTAHPRGGEYR